MKRSKHVELYFLFETFKPAELLRKFPQYSRATVYKYFAEWKQAKIKLKEILK